MNYEMQKNDITAVFNEKFTTADIEKVKPNHEPLPNGKYEVIVDQLEIKDNKAGTGSNLNLRFVVENGPYVDRLIFENLCIKNASPQAERIAKSKLASLCECIGLLDLHSTDQLYGCHLMVSVAIELDKYATEKNGCTSYRNVIRKYLPLPLDCAQDNFDDDVTF